MLLLKYAPVSLSCLAILLLLNSPLPAQQGKVAQLQNKTSKKPGIVFAESSWNNTLKKASAAHKYIFVDAYASWCGPCKLLKSTTFRNEEAAAFFNQNFINLSIDMEKGEGPDLAAKWQIEGYPTLIVFTSDGKPALSNVGFLEPKALIEFGKQALKKNH